MKKMTIRSCDDNQKVKQETLNKISGIEKLFWELSTERVTPLEKLVQLERNTLLLRYSKNIEGIIKLEPELDVIRKQLDKSDEIYPKVASMQAFCSIFTICSYNLTDDPKFRTKGVEQLLRCKNFMEPLKLKPECVWLYCNCMLVLSQVYQVCQKPNEKMKTLEEAKETYEEYMRSVHKESWGLAKIFGKPHLASTKPIEGTITEDYELVCKGLFATALQENNTTMILKYGIQGLKMSHSETDFSMINLSQSQYGLLAQTFLEEHYFRQAKHLLSVAMYLLVQHRRSIDDPVAKKTVINPFQSRLSLQFAQYGYEFLKMSLSMENQHKKEIQHKNQSFETICQNSEVDIYESQFPFELTTDHKILKTVLKKSKLWLERAKELHEIGKNEYLKNDFDKLKKNLQDIEGDLQKKFILENDLKSLKI